MRTRNENDLALEALAPLGIEPPALRSYFERLMSFAHAADSGRRRIARHEVIESPMGEQRQAPEPLAA